MSVLDHLNILCGVAITPGKVAGVDSALFAILAGLLDDLEMVNIVHDHSGIMDGDEGDLEDAVLAAVDGMYTTEIILSLDIKCWTPSWTTDVRTIDIFLADIEGIFYAGFTTPWSSPIWQVVAASDDRAALVQSLQKTVSPVIDGDIVRILPRAVEEEMAVSVARKLIRKCLRDAVS